VSIKGCSITEKKYANTQNLIPNHNLLTENVETYLFFRSGFAQKPDPPACDI